MKTLAASTLALAALLPMTASAQPEVLARVVSSTPVIQQVAVPRQVCSEQPVVVPQQRSGAGAILGAIAGGAMGNAIGDGSGRAAATALGIVGGAMIGDRIEGGGNSQVQQVQQCSTQTFYENRTVGYHVIYEFGGAQYSVQLPNDPGPTLRLQVRPVGQTTLPAPPAPLAMQPAPAVVMQPTLVQPAVVQPVYVQPATISSYTTYVPPPVRPYYAPAPISFTFGYVHRDHYRHPRRDRDRHWR